MCIDILMYPYTEKALKSKVKASISYVIRVHRYPRVSIYKNTFKTNEISRISLIGFFVSAYGGVPGAYTIPGLRGLAHP